MTRAATNRQGWYAVLCLHVNWLLWSGLMKGLGVMLPTLMEQFKAQTWSIGWMISIITGFANCLAPMSEVFEVMFGTRVMVMASGIMIGASLIIASLTTSAVQLTIVLTLGTGPAFSFASILTRAMIGRCFTTHYATANGIAHTGTPVGMILIGPLTQLFLDKYGWRGTLLLLGGISLHRVVCGALLSQPSAENETHDNYLPVPPCKEGNKKSRMNTFKDTIMAQKKLLGISVLFRVSFWITTMTFICYCYVMGNLWVIYYVDHIQEKGFTPYDAVTFTTAAGVGNLICQIGHGPIIDKGWVKLRPAMVILTIVGSVTLIIDPWINSYWLLMANAFIGFGSYGALLAMNDIFTRELFGCELLAGAFSWMDLMKGILCFSLGFFPGLMFDNSGSYDVAFVIMGCIYAMPLVALFVEWILAERSARNK